MKANEKFDQIQKNADWLMRTLKPVPNKKHLYTIPVRMSSYMDLMTTISDLVKAATVIIRDDGPYLSSTVRSQHIDVSGILELALQLFPYDEAELLDTMREIIPYPIEKNQYNYSVIRVLKKRKNKPKAN